MAYLAHPLSRHSQLPVRLGQSNQSAAMKTKNLYDNQIGSFDTNSRKAKKKMAQSKDESAAKRKWQRAMARKKE